MIPTLCLALQYGFLCLHDPSFGHGPVAPRAVFFVCAEPADHAAELRLPLCSDAGQPEEYP